MHNALLSLPGVLQAEIDLQEGLARVRFDAARAGTEAMVEAVARAGSEVQHQYRARAIV